jgi:hypothetical protein
MVEISKAQGLEVSNRPLIATSLTHIYMPAVRTNDNKSRSRPWSGFVAASTAPRPPSTPAHDWIDDYETKAASLSAEVSEAKAVAGTFHPPPPLKDVCNLVFSEGDPTNAAKVLKYHRLGNAMPPMISNTNSLQPPTIQSDSGRRSPTPTSAHTSRGGLGASIKWTSSGIVQVSTSVFLPLWVLS